MRASEGAGDDGPAEMVRGGGNGRAERDGDRDTGSLLAAISSYASAPIYPPNPSDLSPRLSPAFSFVHPPFFTPLPRFVSDENDVLDV